GEKVDKQAGHEVDFQKLFLVQEAENDEDSVSLSSALEVMKRQWITFRAEDLADLINRLGRAGADDGSFTPEMKRDSIVLRDFLFGPVPGNFVASPKSVSGNLKAHRDEPIRHRGETLVLRAKSDPHDEVLVYFVHVVREDNEPGGD